MKILSLSYYLFKIVQLNMIFLESNLQLIDQSRVVSQVSKQILKPFNQDVDQLCAFLFTLA